ncbi:PIN-like domain-containing protein [Clostridium estertheticum]|uniref:PIN-like domain-containing protein n=1 Tax=Clostridium estertheticum TaxID=238834 RepID=UPI001CF2402F|nr:PIN domain-containing protein [Clostridium estertheticum]MCB2361957.1 type II toxin-antitoxin system PemK/MazF family toxin [Clostridium estertheticum]
MINESNISIYSLSSEREIQMWKECIFVFDTCALLDFYSFSTKSQQNIFDTIFEKIEERLWIPGHVEYEFLKNREKSMVKPFSEKYGLLQKEILKPISKNIKELKAEVGQLSTRTKKQNSHPYIDVHLTEELEGLVNDFNNQYIVLNKKIDDEIIIREEEINSKIDNDNVLTGFKKFFKVGKEYNFKTIMEIIKEGELRYKNKIPPGYGDLNCAKPKDGIQIYGDLIVWKQIIEFAKEIKKPIIFISNDVTKGDWCYIDDRNRILSPKEDLIREIKDESNVDFWMYTLEQFMYKSPKLLGSKIDVSVIEEAEHITQSKIEDEEEIRVFEKGDIVWVDFPGTRPAVIVQNDLSSTKVMIAPMSSKNEKLNYKFRTQVELSACDYGLTNNCIIKLEKHMVLDKKNLKQYVTHLTDNDMIKIDKALKIALEAEYSFVME